MATNPEYSSPYSSASAPMGSIPNAEHIPLAAATVIVEPIVVEAIPAALPVIATATVAQATQSHSITRTNMGRHPVFITCPHCGQAGQTRVRDRPDGGSFIWGICCCIIGFWPCALLPLCNDNVRSLTHLELFYFFKNHVLNFFHFIRLNNADGYNRASLQILS